MPVHELESLSRPGGRVITLCQVGDPDGRPAFYLHGTGGSRLEVAAYAKAAGEYGIRLICWDRPGSGGSTAQPGRTMLDVAGDTHAVAEALGLSDVAVIGLSGGGSHALVLAVVAPGLVRRAVAINPGPPPDDAVLSRLDPKMAKSIGMARDRPAAFARLSQLSQIRGGKIGDALRKRQANPTDVSVVYAPAARPLFEASAREGRAQPRAFTTEALIIWGHPWGVELDHFPVPLDVFSGDEDPFRPFCEQLAEAGATLHSFPGGHLSGFAPEVLEQIMAIVAS
jgi:pimeloyl-ACP methyl ester carboxylesterase